MQRKQQKNIEFQRYAISRVLKFFRKDIGKSTIQQSYNNLSPVWEQL